MCRHIRFVFRRFLLTLLILLAPGMLRAGMDEGMARYVPWSGSYWPIREGALIRGPLTKYDQLTGQRSAAWELQQNPPDPSVPEWFGYCHAWASAAVLDREPIQPRAARGVDGRNVPLGIGDQKGMLTACHTDDVAQHYGVRFEGQPGEDAQDIYPDQLWRVLKLFIQQRGVPLIVDIEGGTQVWNYPVYAYRVEYRPTGQGNVYFGEMTLWMADDAVPPDMVGVQVNKQSYYFTFELRDGAAQLGTGRWVEPSVGNHPDFAWYPYVVRAENPELNYQQVGQLVDASGQGPDAASPPPAVPVTPDPTEEPGIALDSPPSNLPSNPAVSRLPPNTVPGQAEDFGRPSDAGDPAAGGLPGISSDVAGSILLSPIELLQLVTNQTSQFTLDVSVDKFDGGHYVAGEPIAVSGTCERDAYLYLFYLDSQGRLTLLFPGPGDGNRVVRDQRFRLPAAPQGGFAAADSPGVHRIKAIATMHPLTFTSLAPWDAAGRERLADRRIEGRPVAGGPVVREPVAAGPVAGGSGTFRLPPSQEALYRQRILAHLQGKPWRSKSVDEAAPLSLVGPFAQDEVAFYVGPAEIPGLNPDSGHAIRSPGSPPMDSVR